MGIRGNSPGSRGADLRGLKVKYAEKVKETKRDGHGHYTGNWSPAGWYIWVQFMRSKIIWQAVRCLRFVREIDALLAMRALTAAGLDSAKRMKAAGGEVVLRTAFEALQW